MVERCSDDPSENQGNAAATLRHQRAQEKLGIPLRVKTYEGRVTELRNIKEGKPDPALFDSPKGFKKAATLKEVLPSDPFLDDED